MISIKGNLNRLPEGIDPDEFDFDHPNSLDFTGMYRCLLELVEGEETKIPVYCFKTHKRLAGQHKVLVSKEIIIFEGILCMHDERIRKLFDLKIFIHCDPDIALARRIRRDINERGRDVAEVLKRYNRFVKRDFDKYVKPQMKYVDFTIPGGASNDVAMNIIIQNLQSRLKISDSKKSAVLSIEDQFKDLLCTDLTKFGSSSHIKSLVSEQKYLESTYTSLCTATDPDVVKSTSKLLANNLTKNVLQFVSSDLNYDIKLPLESNCKVYCKNYLNSETKNIEAKPRLIIVVESVCSNETVDFIIEQHKKHKGIPIYAGFIFIEKNSIERLFKEVDLFKMVCLYPMLGFNYLKDVQNTCTNSYSLEHMIDLGDKTIIKKFGIVNK